MLGKALQSAGKAVEAVYVEDVFSTYLYDGTGASQTITNGIDLSTKGGLVWIKRRDSAFSNVLYDTQRGATKRLYSDTTGAEATDSTGLTAFSSSGFTVDSSTTTGASSGIYASWTFRKQTKFFDVVTYTGNGASNRTISHNLGSSPGCVIVKRTDTTTFDWWVWHRSGTQQNSYACYLNLTTAYATVTPLWGDAPSAAPDMNASTFRVSSSPQVNVSGGTYVAYLFAHDAGGFGASGSDNVISCGSFTTDGSGNATVSLGYEPQFVMLKASSTTGNWIMLDEMRGMTVGTSDLILNANLADAESSSTTIDPTSTGFISNGLSTTTTYIYIAIRRGPMKTPTDATKVFMPAVYTGTNVDNRLVNTTIAPDMVMIRQRDDTVVPGLYTGARLTGQEFLITGSTASGQTDADSFDAQIVSTVEYGTAFSSMNGVWVGNDATRKFNINTTSNNHIIHAFKRAPGFFDVVCYAGAPSATTVNHNLGVIPELMLVKSRSTNAFQVYYGQPGEYLVLNSTAGKVTSNTDRWNNTAPTSTVFSVGTSATTNISGANYIAFLFASCPGVSKVGSYTGNGTSQTIDCGFTAGARFVLIKRTDSTGDWFVYDTARGIVSGNDPQLKLNATTAEATGYDAIDPDNSGFIVNNDATNFPINVNTATYIYLAIA